jgi:hypothetical protein
VEPISRISPTRSGLEPVRGLRPLDRVERDDPREDDAGARKRRDAPKPRPHDVVDVDDDGVAHVDVQA